MAAVDKAKEILESGVSVFLQVSPQEAQRNAARQRVSTLLRGLAQKDGIFALSQLATTALQDPFSKVRGMTEEMAAVDKAKEILESGVSVFLQVSPADKLRNAARQRVSTLLRGLAQKDGVFALSQLA